MVPEPEIDKPHNANTPLNVWMHTNKNDVLTIKINLQKRFGPSKAAVRQSKAPDQTNMIVASTCGFVAVPSFRKGRQRKEKIQIQVVCREKPPRQALLALVEEAISSQKGSDAEKKLLAGIHDCLMGYPGRLRRFVRHMRMEEPENA